VLALCGSLAGCVQRRMMICSDPPGALVYVDNYEIGTTPVSTNFTYYGTRQIRLVKEGYETLTVMEPITTPWYQVPPLDFVTENLLPGELRDQRRLHYQLAPQMVVPSERLLQRAEDLRGRMQPAGTVVPQGGSWGSPGPGSATGGLTPIPPGPGSATGGLTPIPPGTGSAAGGLTPIPPGTGGVPIHPLPPGAGEPYGRP